MDWHDIPSLAALRAFEAAARHESLSAAARELNVTHAAVAQHVRALEQEFADSLLVRQGRGVTATPAGRATRGEGGWGPGARGAAAPCGPGTARAGATRAARAASRRRKGAARPCAGHGARVTALQPPPRPASPERRLK